MTEEQERLLRGRISDGHDFAMETVGARVSLSDVLAEVDALRSALADYEGTDGRCPEGHNKRFTYDMTTIGGEVGCVCCEREDALATLADERRHADALLNALHNPDNITVERAIGAHHARRAAEVANG